METPRGKIYLDPIRKGTPESLSKMLEPINDFKIEDTTETEFENDFTDPYEEITKNYISMKKENRYLNRNEVNKIVMNSFTDDFKKAIADFREEMKMNDKHIFEDIIMDVKENTKIRGVTSEISEEHLQKREKALQDPPLTPVEWKKVEDNKYPEDYSEALWRDLKIKCENSQFRITPIGYNAYAADKTQLEKPDDISREKIESATRKCSDWLNKEWKM